MTRDEIVREVCAAAQYQDNYRLSEIEVDLCSDAARRALDFADRYGLILPPGTVPVKVDDLREIERVPDAGGPDMLSVCPVCNLSPDYDVYDAECVPGCWLAAALKESDDE